MDDNKWQQYRQKAVARHVRKYRELAEAYEALDGLPILRSEHANLQTAVSQAIHHQQTEELQQLAWSLGRPFDGHLSLDGHWSELVKLLEESIRLSEENGQLEIAAAFRADLATVQMWQGNMTAALANYQEALAALSAANPIPPIQSATGSIYQHLGNLKLNLADYPAAREYYKSALSWQRGMNNQLGIAKSLHQLGVLEVSLGDYEEAWSLYQESLGISYLLDDKEQIALTTWNLGNMAYYEGQMVAARESFQKALAIFEAQDDRRNQAGVLQSLGQLAVDQSNFIEARHYAERSLDIKTNLGNRINQPITLGLLGVISYGEGNKVASESFFHQAISLADEVGDLREMNNQRFNLAMLYQDQSRLEDSLALLELIVATDEQLGLPSLERDISMLAFVREKADRTAIAVEELNDGRA